MPVNEMRIVEFMQNSLGINEPITIEPLSKGLSGSEVIRINTFDSAYVIRIWNRLWADYFPQDAACQLIASDAGYGPKVHFSDEAAGITIMDYHFPETLPEIKIRLQALVDLLKKIHKGPSVPKGIDRAAYLDLLIEEIKESNFVDLEKLRIIKDTVFTNTRSNAMCVPCHRDLHHGNLLYTQGSFLAIDYTWGAMDDPYADLANIAIFNCNTLEEEKLLLQLYLGRIPNSKEIARLSLMKLPAKLFYGLEFLGIASANKIDKSISQNLSKSYKDFGRHDDSTSIPGHFLNYATQLLDEVVQYSQCEHYQMDLKEISTRSEMTK